jgi:hypothetical protein
MVMLKTIQHQAGDRKRSPKNPYNQKRFRRIYKALTDMVIAPRQTRYPAQPRLDALRTQHAWWAIEAILLADPEDNHIQGLIADLAKMAPEDQPWSVSRLDAERIWLDCLLDLRQRGPL